MDFKIFSGGANHPLAEKIVQVSDIEEDLGHIKLTNFADGEQYVRFEENLRNQTVFVIQSTNQPDSNLIQLFLMLKAALGASALRVIAVVPYYGYARQERKSAGREAISASLWAQFIDELGIERVVFMDLHANAIEGFFRNTKVDHLYARPVLIKVIKGLFENEINNNEIVVVSPDAGGVNRARAWAQRLNGSDLAIIDKRREGPNRTRAYNVVGEVEGKIALVVDDMFDTCGTVVAGAEALINKGAKRVLAVATHGLFSDDAFEKINNSLIDRIFVTDTVYNPTTSQKIESADKIEVVSVSEHFARAIVRISNNQSLSAALFD